MRKWNKKQMQWMHPLEHYISQFFSRSEGKFLTFNPFAYLAQRSEHYILHYFSRSEEKN